jgi:hypothetical protein
MTMRFAASITQPSDTASPSRVALFLFAITGLFACFALRELRIGSWDQFLAHAPQLMVFPWGVFGVAFWRCGQADRSPLARPGDQWIVMALALACIPLAGEASLVGIGLPIGALGLLIMLRAGRDPALHATAVCLLALCANFTLSPLIFRLFYGDILSVDMALLTAAIDLTGAPVTPTPAGLVADDGQRVLLIGACSSFNGISAAVLVHMGWAMFVRTHIGWRDAIAVMATVALATLLNVLRLTLTASGHDGYAFWHGGAGETPLGGQIFWFLQNAVLLTGGYLSAYWAGRHTR